ncbi:hypothetical protein Dimus_007058 [Dionaea muscipula]
MSKSMEFWGLEVKAGESVMVNPEDDMILHLSQACLGEHKKEKGNEQVLLYADKDGQKFLLGSLFVDKFPHLSFDLVFEDEFELSHNWKNGSVHFAGYRSIVPSDDFSGEDEIFGKLQGNLVKAAGDNGNAAVGNPKAKIVEPIKDTKEEDSDESDDISLDDDDDEGVPFKNLGGDESDESDESDEDDEIEEDAPKKVEPSKKRPAEAPAKTPAPDKKAKLVTPQKTDGKKASGHVSTPHPSKQAGAGKNTADKPKQTPKSGGAFSCTTCSKTFTSEQGLQSHTKAKHG